MHEILKCEGKNMGSNSVKSFTINNNELPNVFFRTISRCYRHNKDTYILELCEFQQK
jgi:hypothetical protein